jgi:streptomycin 6-kinase
MPAPRLDEEVRNRLARRFGSAIDDWLRQLPAVLDRLAARWRLDWGPLIQRGSFSVVIRCRTANGRDAVLKLCPELPRVADEAAALASWSGAQVPAVLGVDEGAGALLLEAIEPGTPLAETAREPDVAALGALMASLHERGAADPSFHPVTARLEHLFDTTRTLYDREPGLVEIVPPDVYERSREVALRLAADAAPLVLLHGDFTPVNILDGGDRGFVAIDPAPCLGDAAFDAVDLVFWGAHDGFVARAEPLARAMGAEPGRLLDWCAACAAMVALERAERGDGNVAPLVELAAAL